MRGHIVQIEEATQKKMLYRKVVFTGVHRFPALLIAPRSAPPS